MNIETDGYRETGAGVLNMTYGKMEAEKVVLLLGAQLTSKDIRLCESVNMDMKLKAAWAHNYGDQNASANANFTSSSATRFNGVSAARDRDSARVGLRLSFNPAREGIISAYLAYDGDIALDAEDHAFRAGVKVAW